MATETQATLVAIFRDGTSANNAVDELEANGFAERDIHISSEEHRHIEEPHRHEGGIRGWFKSIFGRGDDETRYEDLLRSGNILVGVDARGEDVERAASILNNHSPVQVQNPGEAAGSSSSYSTAAPGATSGQTRSIPVVEEELKVGKRAVLRGGVRVYSRTVEEPVEENINLQQEHVRVEREPVNRPATESDFRAGGDQIEVREYSEEPVVSKEARVVEDVRVGKETEQHTETIRDRLRRTETDVENIDESEPGLGAKKNETRT